MGGSWLTPRLSNPGGFTLVSVLVGMGILITVALALSSALVLSDRMTGRADRHLASVRVISRVAGALQTLNFTDLLQVCRSHNSTSAVNPPQDVAGRCVEGSGSPPGLSATAVHASGSNRAEGFLDARMSWQSEFNDSGPVCVELTRCTTQMGGQLMEIQLTGFHLPPVAHSSLIQTPFVFRKSRW